MSTTKVPADVLKFLKSVATHQWNGEWGPDPVRCRFCDCWLYSTERASPGGRVTEVHEAEHAKDCIAVKYLGAPPKRAKGKCTCGTRDHHHYDSCAITRHKEPHL